MLSIALNFYRSLFLKQKLISMTAVKNVLPVLFFSSFLFFTSCQREVLSAGDQQQDNLTDPVFLVIDEESIDNGNEPNNFSDVNVNDQLAKVGLRQPLDYFQKNIGKTITLFTGQVGDEGLYAIKQIPASWPGIIYWQGQV